MAQREGDATAPQPVWARGSAWALPLPGPSALQLARADEALAESVRPPSWAGVQARPELEAAEARAEAVEVAPRAAAARSAVVVPVTEEEAARRPGAAVLAAEARVARRRGAALALGPGQVQLEPVRHLAAAQAAQSWIVRPASTLRPAAPEFPWAGLPAEYRRSLRPAVRAFSAPERRSRARRCGARRRERRREGVAKAA